MTAPPTRRLMAEAAAVFAALVVLCLVRMPALVTDPTGAFWGNAAADAIPVMWTIWHVGWHVVHEASLGVQSQLVGFPAGASLWPATPIEAAALAPLSQTAGAVVAYNLLQVGHLGAAGAATWVLVRTVGLPAGASLVAVPIVALSPVLLAVTHNGNAEVAQLYWIPLAVAAAWRAVRAPGWGWVAAAGALVGLAIIGNIYVGISAATLVAGALLGGVWEQPDARDRWARAAAVIVVSAAVAVPVMALAAGVGAEATSVVDKQAAIVFRMRMLEGAASVAGFVQPGVVEALDPNGAPGPYRNAWSTGWVALALGAWGAWRWRQHPLARGLLVAAAVCLCICLGPVLQLGADPVALGGRYVPLPFVFLDLVPPFSMLIELWRFSMGIQVALAVLAAAAVAAHGWRVGAAAAVLITAEAMLLTPGPTVWQVDRPPDEPAAEALAGLEPGAVLHFPVRQFQWPLYYQTLHHQPVANSPEMVGDPAVFARVSSRPWTAEDLAGTAAGVGYRWLVVHARDGMEQVQPVGELVSDLHRTGKVTRQVGSITIVDLDQPGPWPTTTYQGAGRPTAHGRSDPAANGADAPVP